METRGSTTNKAGQKRCQNGEQRKTKHSARSHSWRKQEGPSSKTLPPRLHVPPTRQEGEKKKEMWPHLFKFMQCSLMMLCCVRALCYAKRRVATLLIALHKLQHLTGAALPFFSSLARSLARYAMWTAGDKLEYVQSVQQIKWLHMFFREGSGVDIVKSEKASAVHELFR